MLIHQEFDENDVSEMIKVIDSLFSLLTAMEGINKFKITVERMPRMQFNFNVEKKRTVNLLQELLKQMDKAGNITSDIRNNYE